MTDAPRLFRHGRGPALVLIHGLGIDHRAWDTAATFLADAFTVLTYDLPGHGARPAPPPYAIADLAQELALALDAEGIAQAHIAGLSLGGLVAQAFAAAMPQRVNKLALIDTTPSYDATWQDIWRDRAETVRGKGTVALVDGLLNAWFTPDFVATNNPVVAYVRDTIVNMPAEGYARGCEALAAAKLTSITARISRPALVVCGEEDAPQFRTAAAWFVETIPGATMRWLPGKHAACLEHPAEFSAIMADFLGARTST